MNRPDSARGHRPGWETRWWIAKDEEPGGVWLVFPPCPDGQDRGTWRAAIPWGFSTWPAAVEFVREHLEPSIIRAVAL